MAQDPKGNLIYFSDRTPEERRELGRIAGIASGEAKRKKKAMKEMLEVCLEMKNNQGLTYRQLATMGLIKGAIKGNAQNYRTILETLGELKPDEGQSKNDGVLLDLVEALNNAKKDR